ncbi:gamma-interferon-inducible lysosomal thiol reductase [Trichonephila inaurata madagascariensis]|uniref:Gamma-interferon-inducible lysosomal thiol reductase n=1 Tax=Trichonephila inaurata madagascariensis TaxID=2747483 RepID=A0A8X6XQJ4_9ARAC|nr:gamma-interferon-inducible lysosomal thiol reductase [Trichonephila inaurata madagascariensis]GFY60798.1 gamma-interferon-inducible lysosomal thiol reductase [Trichonephila inaurata madagascariensis]
MGLVVVLALILGLVSTQGVKAENTVQLNVFYESMCPDSDSFFHEQLWPTYQKMSSYLNVELVPYGNAHYRGQHDEYTFTCQHGPEECYGNMVQTCYIELVNNTESQIKFINCAFESHYQRKVMEKCISDFDLRRQVKKCVTSPMGVNLEYQMAKKTDALNPQHSFIPWVTVNGKGDNSLNNKALENLMSVICDELSEEPKPEPCIKNKWNIFKRFSRYYL